MARTQDRQAILSFYHTGEVELTIFRRSPGTYHWQSYHYDMLPTDSAFFATRNPRTWALTPERVAQVVRYMIGVGVTIHIDTLATDMLVDPADQQGETACMVFDTTRLSIMERA